MRCVMSSCRYLVPCVLRGFALHYIAHQLHLIRVINLVVVAYDSHLYVRNCATLSYAAFSVLFLSERGASSLGTDGMNIRVNERLLVGRSRIVLRGFHAHSGGIKAHLKIIEHVRCVEKVLRLDWISLSQLRSGI